jgi:hypothetical protein
MFQILETTTEPQTSERAMRKMSSSSFGAHLLVDQRAQQGRLGDPEQQVKAGQRERCLGRPYSPVVGRQFRHRAQDQPERACGQKHIGHLAKDPGGERGADRNMAGKFQYGQRQHGIA